jgi:hypothetical protein
MNLDDLAREAGHQSGAELQAHVARRRRLRMKKGAVGAVTARREGARWLADCPFCAGAELVAPGVDFFCLSCGMVANDGHPMTVTGLGGV